MTKKKLSLTSVLLLIGFVPLVLSSAIICIITAKTVSGHLEDAVYQKLYVASDGLRQYYQYDLEHGEEIDYEHDYVDMLKDQDIEMTLFLGDTRFITSALNAQGQRNEGTQMDEKIWARVQKGENVNASGVVIGGKKYYVYYMPLRDASGEIVGASWAGQPETDVRASIRGVLILLIGIVIVSIVLFAIAIFLISKKVIASMNTAIKGVENLSDGNLSESERVSTVIREIDDLGNNVSGLHNKLRDIVGNIKIASDTVGQQSKELSETSTQMSDTSESVTNAVTDMANGATEQAETVQKANENLGSLSEAIQTVAENAEQLASTAAEMNDASQQSAEAVEKLSKNMNQMDIAVKEIASTMDETNRAVNRVNEKVDGITSIASQTNLLSLNASIEAARAGEAGRGFAVVAEEIGKLAKDSATMASEIREEMSALLLTSQKASEKTGEVSKIGKDVTGVLEETSGVVSNLINNVGAAVEGINNISGLTEECNASKELIVDAMEGLSALSEENAASTEETGASMQEFNESVRGLVNAAGTLNDVANKVKEELGFFKV